MFISKPQIDWLFANYSNGETLTELSRESGVDDSTISYYLNKARCNEATRIFGDEVSRYHRMVEMGDRILAQAKIERRRQAAERRVKSKKRMTGEFRSNAWQIRHLAVLQDYMEHPEWSLAQLEQRHGMPYHTLPLIIRKCALFYEGGGALPGIPAFKMRSQEAHDRREFEFTAAHRMKTTKEVIKAYSKPENLDKAIESHQKETEEKLSGWFKKTIRFIFGWKSDNK